MQASKQLAHIICLSEQTISENVCELETKSSNCISGKYTNKHMCKEVSALNLYKYKCVWHQTVYEIEKGHTI